MATREKTVYFAFDPYTSLMADATVTNLTQTTIYIPEASPTFTSVTVDLGFQDVITATGGTIDEHRCGLRLGAAAYTTVTETDNITHSGENMAGVISPFDFASHFNTNWTGTSMTCDLQAYFDQNTGTTLGMRNVTAMLTVTYTYDDDPSTNATQIKTTRIPLESLAGALSTTANSNIGTSQIPQLTGVGGFLPEASVTIRDYFFVIEGNQANNNTTTDFTVSCNIDSGTAFNFGITEAALRSDCFTRLIYRPTPPSSSSSHNFQMWSSVANKMNHVAIELFVTYEFDASTTTRWQNSVVYPIEIASPLGVTTTAEASRFNRVLVISEPGTITLQQSAFRINFNTTGAVSGLRFRAGAQSYRTYTNIGTGVCGMYSLQQRIDSGSAQGAGFTLARGSNEINIDGYATDTTDQVTNINGCIILNYTSDMVTGAPGQNNHTVVKKLADWNALLQDRVRTNGYSFTIPESNYWVTGGGFLYTIWQSTAANAITFDVEVLTGEGKEAGYMDIYADAVQTDTERSCSLVYMRGRDVFKRHPADPDPDRLDMETARDYRLYNAATAGTGMLMMVSYHSHTWTSTLTVSNSNGGTVNIDIFRADTDEKILSTSRVGNGTVDVTWYNDLIDVYAVAYESDTLLTRSANFNFGD